MRVGLGWVHAGWPLLPVELLPTAKATPGRAFFSFEIVSSDTPFWPHPPGFGSVSLCHPETPSPARFLPIFLLCHPGRRAALLLPGSLPVSSSSLKGTVHPRLPLIFPPSFLLQSPSTKLVDVTCLLFLKNPFANSCLSSLLSDLCLMMRGSPHLSAVSPEMPQNQPPCPLLPSILTALVRATSGGQNR